MVTWLPAVVCSTASTSLLVADEWFGLPPLALAAGGTIVGLGALVSAVNVLGVVRRHGPASLDRVVLGSLSPRAERE